VRLRNEPDLDSNTRVGESKRIRGKKRPLTAPGLHALRDKYTRTIAPAPARALAAETLKLERALSELEVLGGRPAPQSPGLFRAPRLRSACTAVLFRQVTTKAGPAAGPA